jgi:hypothetical protein
MYPSSVYVSEVEFNLEPTLESWDPEGPGDYAIERLRARAVELRGELLS